MKNNQALISRISKQLQAIYGNDESGAVARNLLEHIIDSKHTESVLEFNKEWTDEQENYLKHCIERLTKSEPLQYVIGEAWFNGLRFKVNKNVLIPRPETEELVLWIVEAFRLQALKSNAGAIHNCANAFSKPYRIIDIGTGSGCIAVSLSCAITDAELFAMDVSAGALEVAIENATKHGAKVRFINDDVLKPSHVFDDGFFDCIVSNPPYIPNSEKKNMHKNVLEFEPHVALFVDDKNPLLFYDTIAMYALKKLKPGGVLFFEINRSQGGAVIDLLTRMRFEHVEVRKDISGNDRMLKCIKPF